eukprot:CAMPEP_0115318038 /NCGR_PEP_ID=MMETSP0270-20121206/78990_1 /TAXON_ID=71861 /ORGANISM="Scrippsiella trochoidea, Strain CCMP3099" /LENGTH=82 /DNA_ID=CAMNT_0002737579 /DNA_START=14 /DNA_END=258 /DNA_ORIENTATION=-
MASLSCSVVAPRRRASSLSLASTFGNSSASTALASSMLAAGTPASTASAICFCKAFASLSSMACRNFSSALAVFLSSWARIS